MGQFVLFDIWTFIFYYENRYRYNLVSIEKLFKTLRHLKIQKLILTTLCTQDTADTDDTLYKDTADTDDTLYKRYS